MDISRSEFEVMQVVWQKSPCHALEIVARLNAENEWHEKTVKTLLGRLVKKGALSYTVEGRRYFYSPVLAKEAYQQVESQNLVQRLFGGKVSPLIASFAEQGKLNEDDVQALKQIIENWEKPDD